MRVGTMRPLVRIVRNRRITDCACRGRAYLQSYSAGRTTMRDAVTSALILVLGLTAISLMLYVIGW